MSYASIKLLYLHISYQEGQLSPGRIQAKTISHLSPSSYFLLRANALINIYWLIYIAPERDNLP